MRADKVAAVFALLCTTIFWGLSFSSTKVLLNFLLVGQVAFLRLALAAFALTLIFWFRGRQRVQSQDLLRMVAGGAAGMFVYFILENNGLRFTTAGSASLIIAIVPVLNAIIGTIFYREHHPPIRWGGVLLSIGGVYLIIVGGIGGLSASTNLRGNMLVFFAACTWVVYTRINVPLLQKYAGLTVTLYQTLTGMILMGIMILPAGLDVAIIGEPVIMLNLAYLGLLCSAAAYFFYLYGLKTLGSTTATTFLNLVPVFGVLGGAVLLRETLTGLQMLGAGIVILGVSLITALGPHPTGMDNTC